MSCNIRNRNQRSKNNPARKSWWGNDTIHLILSGLSFPEVEYNATIDVTASFDAPISILWRLDSDFSTNDIYYFDPSTTGNYTLYLDIYNGCNYATYEVNIEVKCNPDLAPVADPWLVDNGPFHYNGTQLDITVSANNTENFVEYRWSVISEPEGSNLGGILYYNTEFQTFSIEKVGEYVGINYDHIQSNIL